MSLLHEPGTVTVCGMCFAIDAKCACFDDCAPDPTMTIVRTGHFRIDKDGNWILEIR